MSTPEEVYASNPLTPADGDKVIVDRGGMDGAIDLKDLLFSKGKKRIISGVTDTILSTDEGHMLIYTNVAGCAVAYPDGLDENFQCTIISNSAVPPVITPSGTDDLYNGGAIVASVEPSGAGKAMYLLKYSGTEVIAIN